MEVVSMNSRDFGYDQYILNGGSDECMQNGMWGRCGLDCSVFGCKEECFYNKNDKDLIYICYNGLYTDAMESHLLATLKQHNIKMCWNCLNNDDERECKKCRSENCGLEFEFSRWSPREIDK